MNTSEKTFGIDPFEHLQDVTKTMMPGSIAFQEGEEDGKDISNHLVISLTAGRVEDLFEIATASSKHMLRCGGKIATLDNIGILTISHDGKTDEDISNLINCDSGKLIFSIHVTAERHQDKENRKSVIEFNWITDKVVMKSVNNITGRLLSELLTKNQCFDLYDDSVKERSFSVQINPNNVRIDGRDMSLSNLEIKVYMNRSGESERGYIALITNNIIISIAPLNLTTYAKLREEFGVRENLFHILNTEIL